MRALFAHRDTAVYLVGRILSLAAGNVLWLAMGVWTKILTGSNGAAALTFFAYICGLLFLPVAGVIVDRVRRRTVLIVADLTAVGWVCLLLFANEHRIWLIYAVMFGYGLLSGLGLAAQTALLPHIVPDRLLGEANSVQQVAEQGLRLVTPLLGAGVLSLSGPRTVIVLNALLFLLAGLSMLAVRHREERPEPSGDSLRAEFTAGARFVLATPPLRRVVLAGVVTLLGYGMFQSAAFAVIEEALQRPPEFLGVLQTTSGIGAILGGLVAAAVMRRTGERGLMACGLVGMVFACVPLLMIGWLPTVLLATALLGAGVVALNVGESTFIQRHTPGELLGRVDSAVNTTVLVPQAGSVAVGAALISAVDYRVLLGVMATAFACSALLLSRRSGELPTTPGSGAEPAADEATPERPPVDRDTTPNPPTQRRDPADLPDTTERA